MLLLTKAQRRKLLQNGRDHVDADKTPPVVKLFTPDGQATWLLLELVPEEPEMAFGLCDLGQGFPELGYVDLRELQNLKGPCGLPVERDRAFVPDKPLSEYADVANANQRIIA